MIVGRRRRLGVALCAVSLVGAVAEAADRYVHRRSGLPPWQVERVAATADELIVSILDRGLVREARIPWDEVAAFDPDPQGRLEVGIESGLALGDRIWRGVRRLQRGDARLARLAFEQALEFDPRMPWPLSSAAIEGAVRSGIGLGEIDSVLVEAEVLGELALAGGRSDRFDGPAFDRSTIDESTSLVPEVPPVGEEVDPIELRRRLRAMPILCEASEARRYLWIRLIERAGPPDLPDRGLDRGTRFLLDLARLDAADDRTRAAARARLLEDLDGSPAWRVAWVRWFAGSAQIAHAGDDTDAALLGTLDLVNVLALEDAAPPILRVASLRLTADTLTRLGRTEDAAIIESIFAFEHPDRIGTESSP